MMPYLRLDDQFCDHPKLLKAGPLAGWLHVCGLTYCARLLTDGFVPAAQVKKLADIDEVTPLLTALVDAGLWEEAEGGYRIHDYLEYNPSAEQVKRERAKNAERQARFKEQRATINGGNAVSNALPSRRGNGVTNAVPPHPIPQRDSPPPKSPPKPVEPVAFGAGAPVGVPKPNKSGELIDLLTAADVPVVMTGQDHGALKKSGLSPSQVAEAYCAAYRGEWSDWLQENLSVHAVIARWAGYQASQQQARASPSGRRQNGRVSTAQVALTLLNGMETNDDHDADHNRRRLAPDAAGVPARPGQAHPGLPAPRQH